MTAFVSAESIVVRYVCVQPPVQTVCIGIEFCVHFYIAHEYFY